MIHLTLLTQEDCAWCERAKRLLAELGRDYPLHVEEVDLGTDQGRALATANRLLFAPGLVHNGKLLAHGRFSERDLRRRFAKLTNA